MTGLRRWLLLVLLYVIVCSPACATDSFRLTLLHTNDLHGMMRPHTYEGRSDFLKGSHAGMGGLARRATLIDRLRRGARNPVVVVDTGDLFADGPWATTWFGMAEIEALNAMGYDLFAVGNNEFQAVLDVGGTAQAKMLALMRRSRFPWLAANLTVTGSSAPVEGIHPFVVREFEGVRVGFLGLVPGRVATYLWVRGWTIEDPIAAARRWVPVARQECDILIVTAHLGMGECRELARQVAGIDAIVGGDSHTFTPTPIWVTGPSGRGVPIVQAGEFGVVLGRCDLTFARDGAWRLVAATERLIPITQAIREDRQVKRLLERYLDAPAAPPKSTTTPVPVPAG